MQNTYLAKRARLENYFNEVSSDAWDKLTSNEPVSFVRQLVREGREKMQLAIMEKLPKPFVLHCKSGADRAGLVLSLIHI